MMHPLIRYAFPAALIAGCAGFFAGNTLNAGVTSKKSTMRDAFLASESSQDFTDAGIDYDKLARACVGAMGRGAGGPRGFVNASQRTAATGNDVEDVRVASNSEDVMRAKEGLDHVLSISLQRGVWSRIAAFKARGYLKRLPQSDVEQFRQLLRKSVEQGDLRMAAGAMGSGILN